MELVHEFSVPVPVEQAWQVLTDVERIAPCLPGAELTGSDGDSYQGRVKVKVGPITAQYRGTASFTEKDESTHRVVLKADGRDTRGQGTASATVTAVMVPDEGTTAVSIVTDLSITGRVAQFGRGVMGDVSARLLDQFVRNLEADVLRVGPDGAASGG
jgi:carbon monoxide dehydrogenase subunit G